MRHLRVTSLVLAAALAALAGLTFHRVFGWTPITGAVVGAAVLASGLAWLLGDRLAQRLLVTAPASVLAFFVYATVTQFGAPGAETVRNVLDGVVNGWADTLSSTIPTAPTGGRLTFVIAVVWLAAFAGAELTLRTRGLMLPLLPAAVGFGIAIAFGAGAPGQALGEGLAFVALGAAYVLVRATAADAEGLSEQHVGRVARRRFAVGAPVLVAIVAIGALLVAVLPVTEGRAEYDPHRDAPQPPARLTAVNPLDMVSGVHALSGDADDPVLFTAEVGASDRAALGTPWRLAVLDRYDGVAWTDSSDYEQGGTTVPPADGVDLPTQTVTQAVTIKKLTGPWLPARDRPAHVVHGEVRFGDAGVLVSPSGQVEAGRRYTVESAVPEPKALTNALESALPSSDARYTQLPDDLPSELTAPPTASGGSAVQQIVALARQYSDTYTLQEKASPGHTLRHLKEFAKVHSGTAEQFVAAYAVQTRALGYATRVVIGYESNDCSGRCVVRQSDLIAWPEVKFDGVGWQRMAVVPARAVDDPPEEEPTTTTAPIQKVAEEQGNGAGTGPGRATSEPGTDSPVGRIALAGGVLLLAISVGALLFRVVKTTRRSRRRRNAAAPGARIDGAWHESLDRLVRLGLRPRRSMSASQLVEAATPLLDENAATRLRRLGALETHSSFDEHPMTDADAVVAWEHADEIARSVDDRSTRRQKLAAAFDTKTVTNVKV